MGEAFRFIVAVTRTHKEKIMKEVKMMMSFGVEEPIKLVASFSDDDILVLKQYCEHSARLRNTTIIREGFSSEVRMAGSGGDAPRVQTSIGNLEFELIGSFLHHLRPVYLSHEPASFDKVAELIGRRFSHKAMKRHLKAIRNVKDTSPYSGFGQFTIGEVPVWDNESLKKWMYAFEYHQDPEKKEYLKDVQANLGQDGIRVAFVQQLRQQADAFFRLQSLAQFIIDF